MIASATNQFNIENRWKISLDESNSSWPGWSCPNPWIIMKIRDRDTWHRQEMRGSRLNIIDCYYHCVNSRLVTNCSYPEGLASGIALAAGVLYSFLTLFYLSFSSLINLKKHIDLIKAVLEAYKFEEANSLDFVSIF